MKLLISLWELPQFLLATLLKCLFKYKIVRQQSYKNATVLFIKDIYWGVSLGSHILISENYKDFSTIPHEYGHCIQSKMLGPLYLVIVGIPSISMNILSQILYKLGKPRFSLNYYKRWPENWADKLGDVKRLKRDGYK